MTPSPSSTEPAGSPMVAAGVMSSSATRANSKSAAEASEAADSGIQLVRDLAQHGRNLPAVRGLRVATALQVAADAVEQLHQVFNDDRHVVGRLAAHLGEAGRGVENSCRQRLRTALAVSDSELQSGAGPHGRGSGWQGRGVQEDFLAVIGTDEAEALLFVVELNLAGRHGVPLSRAQS